MTTEAKTTEAELEEIGTPEQNARWDAVIEEMMEAGFWPIWWSVNDVKDSRPDLSTEQAKAVLKEAMSHYQMDVGFCWDDLHAAADMLFPNPEEADDTDSSPSPSRGT
jgi:hypothetical protein